MLSNGIPVSTSDDNRSRGFDRSFNSSPCWNRLRDRIPSPKRFSSSDSRSNRNHRKPRRRRERLDRSRSKSPVLKRHISNAVTDQRQESGGRWSPLPPCRSSPIFIRGVNRSIPRSQHRTPSPRKEGTDWRNVEISTGQHLSRIRDSLQIKDSDRDYRSYNHSTAYDRTLNMALKNRGDFNFSGSFSNDIRDDASLTPSVRPPSLPESPLLQSNQPQINRFPSAAFDCSEVPVTCTSCTQEEIAAARCLDCNHTLCRSCLAAHKFMRIFVNHQVDEFQCLPPSCNLPPTSTNSCRQMCCPQMHNFCGLRHGCCSHSKGEGLWGSVVAMSGSY